MIETYDVSAMSLRAGIVRLIVECGINQLVRHTPRMRTVSLYHRHRFPTEIIGHCVWLYFRFAVSFRDVEEKSWWLQP